MSNKISALLTGRFLLSLLAFFCLIAPGGGRGEDVRAVDVVPDQEMRSSIHSVDGYAYLSEDMTVAQMRAAAFATAKRQALEAAMTYIKSISKVENFQLKYDLIWSNAEGSVTILEQSDHGIEENSRYHVWIKAEVKYDISPRKPETAHASLTEENPLLTVKVWTEKKEYSAGEKIRVYIQGNRDFYARIVDITSTGDMIQLLPNEFRPGNRFKAGKIYKIPGAEDPFDLEVTPPYGEDRIVVYASEVPLGQTAMEPVGQGLRQYRGNRKSLGVMTRGINVAPREPGSHSAAQFYEATWSLITRP